MSENDSLSASNRGMSDDLSRNQRLALDALMNAPSVAAAARIAGLSECTLWRYLRDPAFRDALKERQAEVNRATTGGLVVLSSKAVGALTKLLDDPETDPAIVARVGLGALKARREAIQLEAMAEEMAAIEAQLEEVVNAQKR